MGTGGWAYFNVGKESRLKAYSKVFNFVEVNSTFYEYPDLRVVEKWRKVVPEHFVFAVRCHQDLTHRVALNPVDDAYDVLNRMLDYCKVLNSHFLILETPSWYSLDQKNVKNARAFLSSVSLGEVFLVWEMRAPVTEAVIRLLHDFHIVHCVDFSVQKPALVEDVVYSRLFGKGRHNAYQFDDNELVDIDRSAVSLGAKVLAFSYHGLRMYSDAARFLAYKKTGKFLPATGLVGIDSIQQVLFEDAAFPVSKAELMNDQGWKVVDLSIDKRVHLGDLLNKIPEKQYSSIGELVMELRKVI